MALTTRNAIRLPRWIVSALFVGGMCISYVILALTAGGTDPNPLGLFALGLVFFGLLTVPLSWATEGRRKAVNRGMTGLIYSAFGFALIPLVSLVWTVAALGLARFDAQFFSSSMRNVVGAGGGALHAVIGTIEITLIAALISIPIGLLTSIYLVEYGRGAFARWVTTMVDVMTGIPSIVAGLFAFALFSIFFGPGVRMGFAGAVALSVLMIPVVVRSSEEMLRLVPNELREASLALGVPKWLTILRVVLPTAVGGIVTGIMISIARVIGETAPLLIVAGFTQSMNYNPFNERMMTLPVFVYNSYASQGSDAQSYIDRAWAGALTLIIIVMLLNLGARIVSRVLRPVTTH
jgi:phosphate transport system permease protein